MKQKVEKVKED